MFNSQTKDKQKIDELEKKVHEQSLEIAELKGIIASLVNPIPYELSVLHQQQQIEAHKRMDEEKGILNYIYGTRRY